MGMYRTAIRRRTDVNTGVKTGVRLALLAFIMLAGCGWVPWVSTANGTVTFSDGAAVSWGVIEFVPEPADPTGAVARGEIKADGSFSLATGKRTGLVAGTYRVVIVQTISPVMTAAKHRHTLPRVDSRYSSAESTPLVVEVSNTQPPFETPLSVERMAATKGPSLERR
jgi:hypothetical protein